MVVFKPVECYKKYVTSAKTKKKKNIANRHVVFLEQNIKVTLKIINN